MKPACRKPTRARIIDILETRYRLEVEPSRHTHLGELDLDSMSLLGFLVELEREFKLHLDELRAIARRDCRMDYLIELCHLASLRDEEPLAAV